MKRNAYLLFIGSLFCFYTGTLHAAFDLKVIANPETALPGERIEYTLIVTNTNTSQLTGVVLQSLISNSLGVNYLNLTDAGDGGTCPGTTCQSNERITWNLGVIAANSSRTVRYEAVVQTGSSAPAEGTVLTTQVDLSTDSGDTTVNKDVTITRTPGLELAIAASRNPIVPGETLTYIVNFGNRGTTNQLNNKLRVPIPAGTTYINGSATQGGGPNGGAVEWDLGTLLAGTSGERRFSVTVNADGDAGDAITADAELINSQSQEIRLAAGELVTLVDSTAVELLVTSNPNPALPGERVEYTLTVTNTSASTVTGVNIKSLIPEAVNVNYLNLADAGEGGTCRGSTCQNDERINWDIGSLAANTSRTVRYEMVLLSGSSAPADGSILSTRAQLVYDGGAGSARDDIRVEHTAGLELALAADRDPVVPGETLTYIVSYGNRSTANLLNNTLRVLLPSGTTFISAGSGGSVVNGAVEWELGTVFAGSSGERRFTVSVNAGLSTGDAINTEAQLIDDQTDALRARADEVTTLVAETPVQLFIAANPKPAAPGERVEYTLTVTNTSSSNITGLVVKSLFPEAVSVNYLNLSSTGGGGTCIGTTCQVNERITWDVSGQPLPANTSRTFIYETVLNSGSAAAPDGSILSTRAQLVYDGGVGSVRHDLRVDSAPKLKLAIAADRNPVSIGGTLTYRMVFGNQTASVGKGLKLTAPVPPGTTLVSASPGATRAGDVLTWDLDDSMIAGAIDERSFTVRVTSDATNGSVLEVGARLMDAVTSLVRAESVTITEIRPLPDVSLSSTATPQPQNSDVIVYRLTLKNNTSQAVTGIKLVSLFPEYVTVSAASISDDGECPNTTCQAGERISWDFNVEPLAANASRTLQFDAVLRTGSLAPSDGTLLSNQASVSFDASTGTDYGSAGIHYGVGLDIDSDRDSLPDSWERSNFKTLALGPGGDADGDGLKNINEYLVGADPNVSDTDGDTMPDGYEFDLGLNPLTAADANEDLDGDGFTNIEEFNAGTDPSNDEDAPTFLSGTIKTSSGEDVCALVLASGRFMFSCNPNGVFSLVDLPREKNGTFKRQIYADGFFPKVDVLPDSIDEAVVMTRSGTCPNYNPPTDPGFFPDAAGQRLNISGRVLLQDSQTPICAMALANGQFMFTCDGTGRYALNIPLDANGRFKLQVYADGFAPIIQTFDKFSSNNDVRMARASECQ